MTVGEFKDIVREEDSLVKIIDVKNAKDTDLLVTFMVNSKESIVLEINNKTF